MAKLINANKAILAPLEEAVVKNKPGSQHHHVDNERERTYSLAGSVDAQIKLLAQDLKEVRANIALDALLLLTLFVQVIEKVNAQQGHGGNNQLESITNILSAHTDALQVRQL